MSKDEGFRLRSPCHPGEFVREEMIVPLGLSVTKASEVLGVSRVALSAFLNERAGLSAEMALRIEKAFGLSMEKMMRMQASYDIAQVRKRESEIHVERYREEAA